VIPEQSLRSIQESLATLTLKTTQIHDRWDQLVGAASFVRDFAG